jgi:hypothetical protein
MKDISRFVWDDWADLIPVSQPRTAGGSGSGNFGHAGRPGEVGGSSGGSGESARQPHWPVVRLRDASPSPKEFISARQASTRPGFLSPLTEADLNDAKLYLTHDSTVGGAMQPDGDMGNLFNNGGPKGAGAEVLLQMMDEGGITADAFDGYLPGLYANFGLAETGRMKFNPDYAPPGWDFEKYDSPDVVFLAKTKDVGSKSEIRTRVYGPREHWIPATTGSKYYDDYDAARRDATEAARAHARRTGSAEQRREEPRAAMGRRARGVDSGTGARLRRSLGGPGSGNFGHSGRPGEVGGSESSDGGSAPTTSHEFITQIESNLAATSRTSKGEETPLAGKPSLAIKDKELVDRVTKNTRDAASFAWQQKNVKTPEDVHAVVEGIGTRINEGLVEHLYREHETGRNIPADQIPSQLKAFEEEFVKRMDDPDVVATAAWVEKTFDMDIHPFSDGVGRSTKLLSAMVLARAGHPLPKYQDRKKYYSYGDSSKTLEEFTEYYRTLFPKQKHLGGVGSGNFGHAGRPGEIGGSSESVEAAHQEERASKQTHQLASHPFILGLPEFVPNSAVRRYVAAYGQSFTAAPLPEGVKRGPQNECYSNATKLVLQHPELTYAEGFAENSNIQGIAFAHAWAVTEDGKVVDPTWDNPEKSTYFGVKYDRKAYLKAVFKQKFYGVIGADDKTAANAVKTGAKNIRAAE